MSFHPNDIARRARASSMAIFLGFVVLVGAFFRTQVRRNVDVEPYERVARA